MIIRSLFVFLAGLAAAVPSPQPVSAQGAPVRIATEGAFPPFNLIENGQPAGFEVELGRAFCAAAKLDCTFAIHDWEGIIRGLLAKEYDAIMASLAITDRRKTRIAFSRPYYRIPVSFIGRKDIEVKGVTPEDLAGRIIGTTERSDHAAFVEEVYKASDARFYGKLEEANLDLLTGRIELVVGDKIAMKKFLGSREGACCRWVGDAPHDPRYYSDGIAIGLRKEDKALKEAFNGAIAQVMADGTYDRIRAKYFAFDTK